MGHGPSAAYAAAFLATMFLLCCPSASLAQRAGNDAELKEAERLHREIEELLGRGKYHDALPLAQRSLAIREKVLGPDDKRVAESLEDLGFAYTIWGDFTRAEQLYGRSLHIKEEALGPTHPEVADTLDLLAHLREEEGDNSGAEQLFKRALEIREKASGPDGIGVCLSLDNLADLYKLIGDYERAEQLYRRSLDVMEKTLGTTELAPFAARNIANLAEIYLWKSDYARAESLYRRALKTREGMVDDPETAAILDGLAMLHEKMGDDAQAEQFYRRALAIKGRRRGPDHPEVAGSLINLARIYRKRGDYTRAEPLYLRALAIEEKAFGRNHGRVALTLSSLAHLYQFRGEYARAEQLFRRALAIFEETMGAVHPLRASTLRDLAFLFEAQGDIAQAIHYRKLCNEVRERILSALLASSAEEQKRAYFASVDGDISATISLHLRSAPQNLEAARLALTTLLQRKGRVLDASADTIRVLRQRALPGDRKRLDELARLRSELARRTLRGPGSGEALVTHEARLARLKESARQIEEDLAQRYAALDRERRAVTLDQVQSALLPGSALVEFAVYFPFDPKSIDSGRHWGKRRYAACVLERKGGPRWLDLGEAEPINALVKDVRQRIARREDLGGGARRLDQTLMRPVRELLGGARDLFLAPDGVLNLLPFGALVDEDGKFLLEKYQFTYLTSGRDLLRLERRQLPRERALLLAAPDYGRRDGAEGDPRGTDPSPSLDLARLRFAPLPGAEQEARELSRRIPGVRVFTRRAATKRVLQDAHAPWILHVATHGFFLEDSGRTPRGRGLELVDDRESDPVQVVLPKNPLLRAGLALAGANQRTAREDDGILTALEAASLDLWGTQLVVLSACETGLGDVKFSQGVYGFRHAFVLSGAETQMMSLWQVDDRATRKLMVAYYARVLRGEPRGDALRRAQLTLLGSKEYAHPFYWAPFIVSGDPRPLKVRQTVRR